MRLVVGWTAALLLWVGGTAQAQLLEPQEVRTEISLVSALPQGAFGDHVDGAAPGVAAFLGGRVPGSPLVLGTEVGLLRYGSQTRLDVVEAAVPASVLHVSTGSNVAMGHLVVRLQPAAGRLAPYVDALVGLRYFFSRARVRGDLAVDFDDDLVDLGRDDLSAAATFDDVAFSYGLGGGLDLDVFTGPLGWDERPVTVSLSLGLRYLFGEEATYLTDRSIRRAGTRVTLDASRSRTDMVVPRLGMRVEM